MAHFAQIDENNKVLRVITVNNNELLINGVENETKGINFCKSLFGENTNWVQTSYNNNFRKKYAGIGYTYDVSKDIFISPQPYPSWTLDSNNDSIHDWSAPVPYPEDGNRYIWNEESLNWQVFNDN